MTTGNKLDLIIPVTATADLSAQSSRFRAITINGTLVAAATAAGANGQALGVLLSSARSGDTVSALAIGVTKIQAGAAVSTLGYPVMVGSNGFFFAANSGFSHVGRALETANSGDLFKAVLDFSNFPLWSGA